jgi:hypothetical protein
MKDKKAKLGSWYVYTSEKTDGSYMDLLNSYYYKELYYDLGIQNISRKDELKKLAEARDKKIDQILGN